MKDDTSAAFSAGPEDLRDLSVTSDVMHIDRSSEFGGYGHLCFKDFDLMVERMEIVESDLTHLSIWVFA